MSGDKSTITESIEVGAFRVLAGLPDSADIRVAGEVRPANAPSGMIALFEYPFRLGIRWPFTPLSRAFMTQFSLSPGQLMPQFWRIIQVIERVTKDWGRDPFTVTDLLTAYNVSTHPYHRYGLFPRGRKDTMLVHGTQVYDRGWRSRYVFVARSSLTEEGGWVVPEWNTLGIGFSCFNLFHHTLFGYSSYVALLQKSISPPSPPKSLLLLLNTS
jgi:hypothetical protein